MHIAAESLGVDRPVIAARRSGIAAWPAYDGREPFAEAFLAASDLPTPLRCAHAFAASWRESPTPIGTTELVIGVPEPRRAVRLDRASGIAIDRGMVQHTGTPGLAALSAAMTEFETWRIIQKEKSAAGLELDSSLGAGPSYQGHMLPDYATVLDRGIDGFAARLAASPDSSVKSCFSLMIDTWKDLIARYADAAQAQARVSTPERAEELNMIAGDCRAVIGPPPKTLAQAIQLYWITFLIDSADNAGRLDQLLWPFLREDLAGNRLDGDQAAALLADLFFKLESAGAWGLVLGGTDADGADGSNPLTTFFLELAAAFPQTHPAISLRVSRQTPAELWSQAVQT